MKFATCAGQIRFTRSLFVDPPPAQPINSLASIEDLNGLACNRGSSGKGVLQVIYDEQTDEIRLRCNPIIYRVSVQK